MARVDRSGGGRSEHGLAGVMQRLRHADWSALDRWFERVVATIGESYMGCGYDAAGNVLDPRFQEWLDTAKRSSESDDAEGRRS